MKYYIYIYLDPKKPGVFTYGNYSFNYEPFYMGKGSDDRIKEHMYPSVRNAPSNKHRPFYSKLNTIVEQGLTPIFYIVEDGLAEECAYERETHYIKVIGNRFSTEFNGPLLNMNLGGIGGLSPSQEIRQKLSEANKGRFCGENNGNYHRGRLQVGESNPFYNKTHDDVTKRKMKRKYLVVLEDGRYGICEDIQKFCKLNNLCLTNLMTSSKKHMFYKGACCVKLDKDTTVIENAIVAQLSHYSRNKNNGGTPYVVSSYDTSIFL